LSQRSWRRDCLHVYDVDVDQPTKGSLLSTLKAYVVGIVAVDKIVLKREEGFGTLSLVQLEVTLLLLAVIKSS
jgi:hypothetical protein